MKEHAKVVSKGVPTGVQKIFFCKKSVDAKEHIESVWQEWPIVFVQIRDIESESIHSVPDLLIPCELLLVNLGKKE